MNINNLEYKLRLSVDVETVRKEAAQWFDNKTILALERIIMALDRSLNPEIKGISSAPNTVIDWEEYSE